MEPLLLGRAAEVDLVDSLLRHPGLVSAGLLLRGEPGVGKTALLESASSRATARGVRVLRAFGVQSEAGVDFTVLHQILYPLRHHVDRVDDQSRDALRRVLSMTAEQSTDPLVSMAVLTLLGTVATEHPLLILADDIQWFDSASAAVLGFVASRIAENPVLFLGAARTKADGLLHRSGLPEHTVKPLEKEPAAELLDARWPGLGPAVRQRILTSAAGNPRALLELPAALSDRQRSGQDPLPDHLPLTRRLHAAFAPSLEELPAPTREMLLLAALEPHANLRTLRTAARRSSESDDLAPARDAGVDFTYTADGVVFHHPLTAAAITQTAPLPERRAAHKSLAASLEGSPERRAWHLAEATDEPDETVARALDETTLTSWRRGGPSAAGSGALAGTTIRGGRRAPASTAVAALVRAGELSPRPADRSRRLVEAAYLAALTGQLDQVRRLLAAAEQVPGMRTSLLFAAKAHVVSHGDGDVEAAYWLLARALDEDISTPEDGGWERYGILYALLLVSICALRPEPWKLLDQAMARFAPDEVIPFQLCYEAYVNPARSPDAIRSGLADAFAAVPEDAAPWQLIPLAFAATAMDCLADYRCPVLRMVYREREGGTMGMLIPGLVVLCHDSYAHGRWDEAEKLAREGLELAGVHGYLFWERQLRALLAAGAARRGTPDLAQARGDENANAAAPRWMEVTESYGREARTLAALCQGDYEEAYVQACRVDPSNAPGPGVPGRWLGLDLVEAAARTGRTDEAHAHVIAARRAGISRISSRTALIVAGAAALAAPDAESGPLFEAALALPEAARWPWEHARVQLAYGQWLRRTRDSRARQHLNSAFETFDRIGARAMAERARNELRASGVGSVRVNTPPSALTAQQRQIAELAAIGLSNKQIGERLFLSHRTVGSHLQRLYPKLGITSRAALSSALKAMITMDEHTRAP
ncbi:regulatory LuxR family protein [Streptomyces sp. 846.5]|nr:AAA family ATPase [Streptomyces sp. 846.5]TDU03420.1 regulatory LuxR family protein [Streptomyces sp. 846.5]